MKRILTTQELKKSWNKFGLDYINYLERCIFTVYVNILNLSKLEGKSKILELACGGGHGLRYLVGMELFNPLNQLTNTKKIFAGELAENMLIRTYNNLKTDLNNNDKFRNFELNHFNVDEVSKIISHRKEFSFLFETDANKTQINLLSLNNENLEVFDENYFDAVISNMSLNLVNDPSKMLKETSRVLNKENKDNLACFSIWGRPERSFFLTLVPNTLKKFEIKVPNIRSNFHLSNEEKLRDLVLSNGFNKVKVSYVQLNLNHESFEDFEYLLEAPTYKELFEEMEEKLRVEVIKDMRSQYDEVINSWNKCIDMEAFIVRCRI